MHLCYAVMQFDQAWRIVSDRRQIGRFATRELASSAGARLALEAREAGHEVEFLVQQGGGELVRREPEQCLAPAEPLPA